VFYSMAREGLFFQALGKIHPRCETPHVAVVVAGVIAIVYVSLRNFDQLIATFILGLWPFYALAVLGVIVLRIRQPQTPRTYRTWGYPVVPLVFVAGAVLVLANSFMEQRTITLLNVAISLSGIPVYFIWRAFTRPKH
jgi:APA family basic amino acid/polyamine antiporter